MTVARRRAARPVAIAVALLVVCLAATQRARAAEQMTPLLLAVHDAPIPFRGSDGRTHLVDERWITNFSRGAATVEQVGVLRDGTALAPGHAPGGRSRP